MSVILVYGFTGKYEGPAEYEWTAPEPGAVHRALLFLRQPSDSDAYEEAAAECRRYGFGDVTFSGAGKLQVEVLNTDTYRGFTGFYEEALREGSAVVYYPNQAGA